MIYDHPGWNSYEYLKARIRAKVEHPFRIIKCPFDFVKARYKGLAKSDNQLAMSFNLANLVRVDRSTRAWESCAWNQGKSPEKGGKQPKRYEFRCECEHIASLKAKRLLQSSQKKMRAT